MPQYYWFYTNECESLYLADKFCHAHPWTFVRENWWKDATFITTGKVDTISSIKRLFLFGD